MPKIEIERSNDVVTLFVHCARPGMVIGKDGAEVEKLRLAVEALIGKKVKLNIVEMCIRDRSAAGHACPFPEAGCCCRRLS